ncbi:MAG: class I SAM-dependent methyltransferase [Pseudomonadota bacterium]
MASNEADSANAALAFTGERFTPECLREIYYEHWHRYAWATQWVEGLRVLDAACGEGYGSHLLATHADRVDGVDIDPVAIEHARSRYVADGLNFHQASILELPFPDHQFDCVVSFETLEHLVEHDPLLGEFQRVLKPTGFLILSSPDKKTYSDNTGYQNEFHLRELYRHELEALLGRHFQHWRLLGQKLMFQSALWPIKASDSSATQHLIAEADGQVSAPMQPVVAPMYFVALAAQDPTNLPDQTPLSLFSDRNESVYAHYYDVVRKHIQAEREVAAREREIERLQQLKTPLWTRLKQLLTG